jgi:hypothetical protein
MSLDAPTTVISSPKSIRWQNKNRPADQDQGGWQVITFG